MPHAIEEHDLLAVGYTDLYGEAWHRHENCSHYPGAVGIQVAEEIFDFDVEKRPVLMRDASGEVVEIPGQWALVDVMYDTVLSPVTVGAQYAVVQNKDWLAAIVGGVLSAHDLRLESCGTLFNRARAFVNIVVMEHTVKGDVSPTRTRLLYTNGFDQRSYAACVSQIRVVCANTMRLAQAQGAANNTLRKFRHTAGATAALQEYAVELCDVVAAIKLHNDQMDHLATLGVSPAFAAEYLGMLFGYDEDDKDGRGKTRAKNKVEQVMSIFETKDDLNSSEIRHTQYALLNAVTDWADHTATVKGGSDSMYREWDGVLGHKDKLKQRAVALLGA